MPALAEIFDTGVGQLLGSEKEDTVAEEDTPVAVDVAVDVEVDVEPPENLPTLPPVITGQQTTYEHAVDSQGDYTVVLMRNDVIVEKFPFSPDAIQVIVNLQGSCRNLAVSVGQVHICGDVEGNAAISHGGTV